MTDNQLSKNLMCIMMRGNIEIWIEKDKTDKLMELLENGQINRFVRIDNQFINVVDVMGIFSPETMKDRNNIRAGKWKCQHNIWHIRNEECFCWKKY